MRVDRNRIRKEKVADSKISGYVRTEPYVMSKGAMAMGFSDPVHTTPEKFQNGGFSLSLSVHATQAGGI